MTRGRRRTRGNGKLAVLGINASRLNVAFAHSRDMARDLIGWTPSHGA